MRGRVCWRSGGMTDVRWRSMELWFSTLSFSSLAHVFVLWLIVIEALVGCFFPFLLFFVSWFWLVFIIP